MSAKSQTVFFVFSIVAMQCNLASAQGIGDLSPWINEDTVLVAIVDATLELTATQRYLVETVNLQENGPDLYALLQELVVEQQGFRAAGGKRIALVGTLPGLLGAEPLVLVQTEKTSDTALAQWIKVNSPDTFEVRQHGEWILVGNPSTVANYEQFEPAPRPDLLEAARGTGDTHIQIVISLSPTARRLLREFSPSIDLEGFDFAEVLGGLTSKTIGVNLGQGRPAARVVVRFANESAAEKATRLFDIASRKLADLPEIRKELGDIGPLFEFVKPRLDGLFLDTRLQGGMMDRFLSATIPKVQRAYQLASKSRRVNQLRSLALSILNFESACGSFPPSASYDRDGTPLLSWRVYVLPFLGEEALYKQFRLDEPWNSDHNQQLIPQMPAVFKSSPSHAHGMTTYLLPRHESSMFPGEIGLQINEMKDGLSRTIMIVNVAKEYAVHWTKPTDAKATPAVPLAGIIAKGHLSFQAAFGDGHIQTIEFEGEPTSIWHYFTRAANDGP